MTPQPAIYATLCATGLHGMAVKTVIKSLCTEKLWLSLPELCWTWDNKTCKNKEMSRMTGQLVATVWEEDWHNTARWETWSDLHFLTQAPPFLSLQSSRVAPHHPLTIWTLTLELYYYITVLGCPVNQAGYTISNVQKANVRYVVVWLHVVQCAVANNANDVATEFIGMAYYAFIYR